MDVHYFKLLSRSTVEQLLRSGSEFQSFLDHFLTPVGPVRRFPNGAVEIDEGTVGDELSKALRSCATPGREIEGAYVFKTLGPFTPKRYYCIQYPVAYQEKLRSEASFAVGQGRVRPPAPGEFNLKRLEVTVGFRARVGKAIRRLFVDTIFAWGGAAVERGAFEDGPVYLASPSVEFSGTRARFLIDASLSGQDTINWLSLAILDFGEDVHTVTGVYFGSTAEFLDAALGPAQREWVLVEFPAGESATLIRPAMKARTSYVPPDAQPYQGFVSRRFPVLTLPVNEWDSFFATVYFGRPLLEEERRELARLIDAWFLIGAYGGFGGAGTHSADRVVFDDATDSVILRADMGDADPDIALPLLTRALEGFESSSATIDALVLGH